MCKVRYLRTKVQVPALGNCLSAFPFDVLFAAPRNSERRAPESCESVEGNERPLISFNGKSGPWQLLMLLRSNVRACLYLGACTTSNN